MSNAKGQIVASVLAGAWREAPPPLHVSPADIAAVAPLLIETGAGSLAHWRVKSACAANPFHQVFRRQALDVALGQHRLLDLLTRLHSAGIESLVVKGWSNSRLYAHH